MSFPLREHEGDIAKASRRLGADRNFVKKEEEEKGEVTGIKVDAKELCQCYIDVHKLGTMDEWVIREYTYFSAMCDMSMTAQGVDHQLLKKIKLSS
ncbi:hypothetical protein ACFX15_034532 [Malus domestica]